MFLPHRWLAAATLLLGGWSAALAESEADALAPIPLASERFAATEGALAQLAPAGLRGGGSGAPGRLSEGSSLGEPTLSAAPGPTSTPPILRPDSSPAERAARERRTLGELLSGRPSQSVGLREAIEMALKNNLDARYERITLQIQRAQVEFAAGVFDPVFQVSTQYQDVRQPQNINNPSTTTQILQQQALQAQLNSAALQLNAAQTQAFQSQLALQQEQQSLNQQYILLGQSPPSLPDALTNQQVLQIQQIQNPQLNNIITLNQNGANATVSLSGRTGIGTRYALQATGSRQENTFTGDINPVEAIYQDSIGLQIQQPLLRNFGPDANLADKRTAQLSTKVQALTWKNTIAQAVQAVMSAYYDMSFALEAMRVQEDAISADERLTQLYRRRVDLGFGSPFDVQQAAVQVGLDQETLLLSKNTFLERQFALKRLILKQFEVTDPRIFLPGAVTHLPVPVLSRQALLEEAFRNRYDYQATLLNAEAQNIRLKFAKNQLLPALDLVGTYGLNGLGDNFGRGVGDTFSADNPQWSVGLQLQVPIGNRQARAQYKAVIAAKEQAIIRIRQSELGLGVDVDTAISRIETNRQRYEAARKTRELGDEAIRIAFRRLEEGQISAYDITDQQRRLYDAKTRELAARAELSKSVTVLWLVTGTILPKQDITFTEAKDTIIPPVLKPGAPAPARLTPTRTVAAKPTPRR